MVVNGAGIEGKEGSVAVGSRCEIRGKKKKNLVHVEKPSV